MVLKNEAQIYESVNLQTEKNKYMGAWLHVNFMFLFENALSAFIIRPADQIVSWVGLLRKFSTWSTGFGRYPVRVLQAEKAQEAAFGNDKKRCTLCLLNYDLVNKKTFLLNDSYFLKIILKKFAQKKSMLLSLPRR